MMKYTGDDLLKISEVLFNVLSGYCDIPDDNWKADLLLNAAESCAAYDTMEKIGARIKDDVNEVANALNEYGDYPKLDDLLLQCGALNKVFFRMGFSYGMRIGRGEAVPNGIIDLADFQVMHDA